MTEGPKRPHSKREQNSARKMKRARSWARTQKRKDANVLRSSHGKWTRLALIAHALKLAIKKTPPHKEPAC